jgi:acyl-CoA dehydrogenase
MVEPTFYSPLPNLYKMSNISANLKLLISTLTEFVTNDCISAEKIYESQLGSGNTRWTTIPHIIETLKTKAKALGL